MLAVSCSLRKIFTRTKIYTNTIKLYNSKYPHKYDVPCYPSEMTLDTSTSIPETQVYIKDSIYTNNNVKLSIDERINLITRNQQEVMGGEEAIKTMKEIMSERNLRQYWGTATTGKPHIAYLVPLLKIADFLLADVHVTILCADLHAVQDSQKTPLEFIHTRAEYYKRLIQSIFNAINVPVNKLHFVFGTDFELKEKYTLDVYKLATITTERNAKKAGCEVVKQSDTAALSSMLYPLLQALDEEYLNVDIQFGGVDQRKIFTYAETYLPKLKYKKRIHLMNPMIPSFNGTRGNKMSSSDVDSKIDFLESSDSVQNKILRAYAPPGNIENNGLLAFTRYIIFPLLNHINTDNPILNIYREEKFGGNITFKTYDELEDAYKKELLYPLDLKHTVANIINTVLDKIRKDFSTCEAQELLYKAYPLGDSDIAITTAIKDDNDDTKQIVDSVKLPSLNSDIYKLDLCVGKCIEVDDHPQADSLYVCKIDVGDTEPQQVVTNMKKTMSKDEQKDNKYIFLLNMKPTSFRGIKSFAMFLGGDSNEEKIKNYKEYIFTNSLVIPSENSKPGERVYISGESQNKNTLSRVNPKIISTVFEQLSTDDNGFLVWGPEKVKLSTASGLIRSPFIPTFHFQ